MKSKNHTLLRVIFLASSILTAVIISNLFQMGSFNSTRTELKELHKEEFNGCKILEIIDKKYPGRGMYSLFKVDCKRKYYPLLFDKSPAIGLEYFDKHSVIRKNSNSNILRLEYNGENYDFVIRSIDNEKDSLLAKYILPIPISLFIVGSLLIILNWIWNFY